MDSHIMDSHAGEIEGTPRYEAQNWTIQWRCSQCSRPSGGVMRAHFRDATRTVWLRRELRRMARLSVVSPAAAAGAITVLGRKLVTRPPVAVPAGDHTQEIVVAIEIAAARVWAAFSAGGEA